MIARLRERLARLERERPIVYAVVLLLAADACVLAATAIGARA